MSHIEWDVLCFSFVNLFSFIYCYEKDSFIVIFVNARR